LCEAEFTYNNTWQASINATPFQLTFGQDPRVPFQEVLPTKMTVKLQNQDYVPAAAEFVRKMRDSLEHARQCLKAAQDRMKEYADRRRREPPPFKVGDEVLLSTKHLRMPHSKTRKLLPRFVGPFPIDRVVSPVAFKLRLPKHMRIHNVFHVSLLKPYKRDGLVQPPPPPDIIDDEFEYEVEAVLAHRERRVRSRKKSKKSAREYLVKWVGYGDINNTWEPEEHLEHARERLQEYWVNHGVVAKPPEVQRKPRKKRKTR
jgi:hypothetical protein